MGGVTGSPGKVLMLVRGFRVEISLDLIVDSVRKAREAHLIDKAMTLKPNGINRRDELNS